MGCQQLFVLKAHAKVQPRLEYRPRLKLKTLSTTTSDSMKGGKNSGRNDVLRCLLSLFPLCPVVCSGSPGSMAPGFLLCVAQKSEDSIDIKFN